MKIGETKRVGAYDVMSLKKGTSDVARFTDRGESIMSDGSPATVLGLARRRTAMSTVFGEYLNRRKIPQAFLERESETSVICRRFDWKIPLEVKVRGGQRDETTVWRDPPVMDEATTLDESHAKTLVEARQLALDAYRVLETVIAGLKPRGATLRLLDVTFTFGFVNGEGIALTGLTNFDTMTLVQEQADGSYTTYDDYVGIVEAMGSFGKRDGKSCRAA